MTLKYVNSVPEKNRELFRKRRLKHNKVMQLITEFNNDHRKIAIIQCDADEKYNSISSVNTTFRRAIRSLGYPIQVHVRDQEIYLVKD